ncbi:hypothetical protein [Natronospora cellulosivora (SeqCode)]
MKWVLRLFLTVVMIAIMGSIGLIYVMSREIVPPDISNIELNLVFDNNIRQSIELRQEKQHLLTQKTQDLEEQAQLLEDKKRLLEKRTKELDEYIFNELKKVRDRYQREIDIFENELDHDYMQFERDKQQEYVERIMVRQELYQRRMLERINHYEESLIGELAENNQKLMQEYYRKKLNYDLKMNFLDLSEEHEAEYKEKLDSIEKKILGSLEEREEDIYIRLDKKANELELEFNGLLRKYENNLKEDLEKDLYERQLEDNQKLDDFLRQQEKLMDDEFLSISQKINERSEEEFATLRSLIQEISKEYYQIQSEVSILEKEVMY